MRTERMRMVVALAVVAAMGVTLAGTPAQALLVKNDGNTIFDSGGFEGETAGFNPTNATVGSWSSLFVNTGGLGTTAFITNDAGSPGPGTDTNYFTVNKTGLPNNTAIAAQFTGTATTGTVTLEWMHYVDSSSTSGIQLYTMTESHVPGTATGFHSFFTFGGNGNILHDTGSQEGVLPLDQWFDVEMTYTVGNPHVDIAINGGAPLNIAISSAMSGFAELCFRDGGGGGNVWVGHMDSIPEPASLSLVALGGLMMLRRRR